MRAATVTTVFWRATYLLAMVALAVSSAYAAVAAANHPAYGTTVRAIAASALVYVAAAAVVAVVRRIRRP